MLHHIGDLAEIPIERSVGAGWRDTGVRRFGKIVIYVGNPPDVDGIEKTLSYFYEREPWMDDLIANLKAEATTTPAST